jgi:hypothetical protein
VDSQELYGFPVPVRLREPSGDKGHRFPAIPIVWQQYFFINSDYTQHLSSNSVSIVKQKLFRQ